MKAVPTKTTDKIIQLLKTQGAMTAKLLAAELGVTTMGIRQHMQQLEDEGDVIFEDKKAARGRPTRYWALTSQSKSYFPDGHETLTVQLIDSVKTIFGNGGLEQLIEHREHEAMKVYRRVLSQHNDLLGKLEALADIRTEEGYMASVVKEKGYYWLIENHCSICAAASECLSFCRSELQQFQALFKNLAAVSREEHIMEGARRCAYKVLPLS